jgi:phosphopantetheinyl transferase
MFFCLYFSTEFAELFFSWSFTSNLVPFYLETNLSKSIKSKITQLGISAHCLNIERGKYNKPKIPREE